MSFLDAIIEARRIVRERREKEAHAKERAAAAKAFNDLFCYVHLYDPQALRFEGEFVRAGNRWMCPECNRIHAPTKLSVFSGLQYPACCSTGEGHRLSHGIKIKP